MKSQIRRPFQITTYTGVGIEYFEGQKPPGSAKFLASFNRRQLAGPLPRPRIGSESAEEDMIAIVFIALA